MKSGRHYAARSIKGARPYQEDDCGFNPHSVEGDDAGELLLVLADGMGGHKGGAHASKTAVQTFIDVFNSRSGDVGDRLSRALEHANRQVGIDGEANPELEGMGCTLVGAYVAGDTISWVSVGDSPMWVYRDGTLQRLNEDHSMGAVLDAQVQLGKLSQEAAASDPQRHALLSAVTGEPLTKVDGPSAAPLQAGDRIVLASDGVLTLSDDEIAALLADAGELDADATVRRLTEAVEAKQSPRQDNTTIMVVDADAPAADEPATIEIPDRAAEAIPGEATARRAGVPRFLLALILLAAVGGIGLFAYQHLIVSSPTDGDEPATELPEDESGDDGEVGDEPPPPLEPEQSRVLPVDPPGWAEAVALPMIDDQLIVAGNMSDTGEAADARPWVVLLDDEINIARRWDNLAAPGRVTLSAAVSGTDELLMAGTLTKPAGDTQIWIQRLDIEGDGPVPDPLELGGDGADEAEAILPVGRGGVLVAGRTRSDTGGGWDGVVYRLSVEGSELWRRVYGGPGDDRFTAIAQTEGGYVLAGSTYAEDSSAENAWLVYIDETGEMRSEPIFEREADGRFVAVAGDGRNGIIVAGSIRDQAGAANGAWLESVARDATYRNRLVFSPEDRIQINTLRVDPTVGVMAAGSRARDDGPRMYLVRSDLELSGAQSPVELGAGTIAVLRHDPGRSVLWAAGTAMSGRDSNARQLWVGRIPFD